MSVCEVLCYSAGSHLNMSPRPCDVFYISQMTDAASCTDAWDATSSAAQLSTLIARQGVMCYGQITFRWPAAKRIRLLLLHEGKRLLGVNLFTVSLSPAAPSSFPCMIAFQFWSQNWIKASEWCWVFITFLFSPPYAFALSEKKSI